MRTKRTIVVVTMPKCLTLMHNRAFLREVDALLRADRPRIVFDCSQVQKIDRSGTEMLLHCVEQVIRQDGDLTLASVPAEVMVVLQLTRVDQLFEIFASNSDAVESYNGLAA